MATKRIKIQPVTGKAEAEAIIDEIARLEIARQKSEADLKAAIQAVEEARGPAIKELKERITLLMARVEPYIASHQVEMFRPGTRSGETALSTFGMRTGNPTVVKPKDYTWDALANLFILSETLDCFVRQKLSVDKEEILQQWNDQTFAFHELVDRYGVEIQQADTVWVQAKAEEVAG